LKKTLPRAKRYDVGDFRIWWCAKRYAVGRFLARAKRYAVGCFLARAKTLRRRAFAGVTFFAKMQIGKNARRGNVFCHVHNPSARARARARFRAKKRPTA